MDKQEIKNWSGKYIDGGLTDQERASFEDWYLKQGEVPVETPLLEIRETGEDILKELPRNSALRFNVGAMLAAAAIVLVFLSLLLQLVFHQHQEIAIQTQADISPGDYRAVLTLASGQKIDLAHAGSGRIAVQQGSRILKGAAGQLVYQNNELSRHPAPSAENTIVTPAGGIWKLCLADGTKVWLNNSSALTYPTTFRGQKRREVSLEGEAYFEVAKNQSQPFIVKSRNQEVRVLGTHFNIHAFKDEQFVRTTLLEGSVTINNSDHQISRILVPGQQASWCAGHLTVHDVDASKVMAWKDGYFQFDNAPIEQVMRELVRWYDIEVIYEGRLSSERWNGKISRNRNISKVLIALEATRTVHFKIEGRRVTVMK